MTGETNQLPYLHFGVQFRVPWLDVPATALVEQHGVKGGQSLVVHRMASATYLCLSPFPWRLGADLCCPRIGPLAILVREYTVPCCAAQVSLNSQT